MDCIVLAGGRPSQDDPLYQYSRGEPKALIDIAGKPMIAWVLEALLAAESIDSIAVVGLEALPGYLEKVVLLPDEGSLVDNLSSGLSWIRSSRPDAKSVLLCSSDVPFITGKIVDHFFAESQSPEFAVYYPVATRDRMKSRFPQVTRTYVKLADLQVAGGDLIVIHQQAFNSDLEVWRSITNARKYPWRIARIIGISTLFKLVTRQLTLKEATMLGEKIVGYPVKVILSDYPEIAMDVDSPEQMKLAAEELKTRSSGA